MVVAKQYFHFVKYCDFPAPLCLIWLILQNQLHLSGYFAYLHFEVSNHPNRHYLHLMITTAQLSCLHANCKHNEIFVPNTYNNDVCQQCTLSNSKPLESNQHKKQHVIVGMSNPFTDFVALDAIDGFISHSKRPLLRLCLSPNCDTTTSTHMQYVYTWHLHAVRLNVCNTNEANEWQFDNNCNNFR